MPREIMTLQLGGYANYIGSHFWNMQEECMSYDMEGERSLENSEIRADILWRQSGETVVPRLMTLDVKSARGALRRRGYLGPEEAVPQESVSFDVSVDAAAWGGPVASFYSEQVPVHPFVQHMLDSDAQAYEEGEHDYDEDDDEGCMLEEGSGDRGVGSSTRQGGGQAGGREKTKEGETEEPGDRDESQQRSSKPDFLIEDDTVRYWSDFLKVSFHARTCHDLTQGFGADYLSYCAGVGWDADDAQREEWEENLHWWLEECDTLQGFHILADTDTAFGAIATDVCARLRDDFPRTPFVLAGAAPNRRGRTPPQQRMHASSEAISLAALAALANVYTPIHGPRAGESLSMPEHMRDLAEDPSFFRTAALAASALDTATLPWRLRRKPGESVELLSRTAALFHGHSVAALQAYMPVPAVGSAELEAERARARAAGRDEALVSGVDLRAWLARRGAPLRLSPYNGPKRGKLPPTAMGVGMGKEWTQTERAKWDLPWDRGTGDHHIYTQAVALRGLAEEAEVDTLREVMQREQMESVRDFQGGMQVHAVRTPMPVPVAFPPRLFAATVGRHGDVGSALEPPVEPACVKQMTALQASGSLAPWMASMGDALLMRDGSDAAAYAQVNLGQDERQELREKMLTLLDSYEPDDDSGDE